VASRRPRYKEFPVHNFYLTQRAFFFNSDDGLAFAARKKHNDHFASADKHGVAVVVAVGRLYAQMLPSEKER